MAKYVSEDRLLKLREHFNKDYSIVEAKVIQDLLNECKELNPWMTLDEFLKSGFEGLCWVILKDKTVDDAYFNCGKFFGNSSMEDIHDTNCITRVQPIHKPEPPR